MYTGPHIVEDGLVFAVDAGSERSYAGSGTTTYNLIDNASGTLTNGVGYLSSNGGTFDFDGTDDFIVFPDNTNLNSQTITMESWSYLDASTNQSAFLFEKGNVNTQYSNFFNGGYTDTFYFRTQGTSIQDLNFTTSTYITADTWNHIVCTYGSGTKKIYVNGVQIATQTGITGTIPTVTTGLFMGAYGPGTSYFINGRIAVSRVYNTVLTQAEVTQNYIAQKDRFNI
jgi:hypothetical protein